MKVLLVYPEFLDDTFWSFKNVVKIAGARAGFPPLGLLTIAAMLPPVWELKLVDMNVEKLRDKLIKWADYVFLSAMMAQTESAKRVIALCNKLGIKVVAGGPAFASDQEDFPGVDHFVLGEAEVILPQFIKDLEEGQARQIYSADELPDMATTPVPMWSLIKKIKKKYASLIVQASRGCPFHCEFCNVNGVQRYKTPDQISLELDAILATGFRGAVFVADDNLIGNRTEAKKILIAMEWWQQNHDYPFTFSTQASVNLANDEYMMQLMTGAGFTMVFLGLETTSKASLQECGKKQNEKCDIAEAVRILSNRGLLVYGGFIVGFDNDPDSVFDDLIDFLQQSPICVAMVGILQAFPNTKLHERLEREGRLTSTASGNNSDASTNFKTRMNLDALVAGYKRIIRTIYSPGKYYERILNIIKYYKPAEMQSKIKMRDIMAFLRSIWYLGILSSWKVRQYYWKALIVSFFSNRAVFPKIVVMLVYGNHFMKVAESIE